jgi:predicted  nucleic acid-binding Zn-ribbon protein
LWAIQQAALLREGRISELDFVHIAEELDDVGSEIYQRLESALTVLLMHMLKWDHQSDRRSRSWEATIREQRRRVEKLIKENPSLKSKLPDALSEGYQNGRDRASGETDLPVETFPEECPYSLEVILKREFSLDAPSVTNTNRP